MLSVPRLSTKRFQAADASNHSYQSPWQLLNDPQVVSGACALTPSSNSFNSPDNDLSKGGKTPPSNQQNATSFFIASFQSFVMPVNDTEDSLIAGNSHAIKDSKAVSVTGTTGETSSSIGLTLGLFMNADYFPEGYRSYIEMQSWHICGVARKMKNAPSGAFFIFHVIRNHYGQRARFSMAGDEGFEPPNGGFRVRCLTTWRIPNEFDVRRG